MASTLQCVVSRGYRCLARRAALAQVTGVIYADHLDARTAGRASYDRQEKSTSSPTTQQAGIVPLADDQQASQAGAPAGSAKVDAAVDSTDPEVIGRWWMIRSAQANVAMRTSAESDIVTIDPDLHKSGAREALSGLRWQPTRTHRTAAITTCIDTPAAGDCSEPERPKPSSHGNREDRIPKGKRNATLASMAGSMRRRSMLPTWFLP